MIKMTKEIFNYLPARIFSFYNEAHQILDNEMPLPRALFFWPVCGCNLNCKGCDWGEQNKKSYFMPTKDWKNIFKQLKNVVKSIEFSGLGEPTLHPDFLEMLKQAKKNNWAIGLITNGTQLGGSLLEYLVKHALYIRVSMESGSETVYNEIKKPGHKKDGFKAVIDNLKHAVKLKKQFNSNVNLGYKFTVGRDNFTDIEKAVEWADYLKLSSIQFKCNRHTSSEIGITKKRQLDKQIQRLKKKYKIKIVGSLLPSKMTTGCFMSPIQIVIDSFADVFVCCYYRHRMKSHRLGNLLKDGFLKVWFGKKHFEIIKNIDYKLCQLYDCKFFRYNELLNQFMVQSRDLDTI